MRNYSNKLEKRKSLLPEHENKGVRKSPFLNIKKLSNFGRLLLWLFSETKQKQYIFQMISAFNTMFKRNGVTFLVLYLKEAHRLTLKALSGQPEVCKTFPRVATRLGFPLIIPGSLRVSMFKRDIVTIQLVLSVLSVYRILKVPPQLKLSSITDLFTGSADTLPLWEVREAMKVLHCIERFKIIPNARLLPNVSAGPNSKISILGATLDAWALREHPELLSSFKILGVYLGSELISLLEQEIEFLPTFFNLLKQGVKETLYSKLKLGKLSEKIEAAGKVRVFAITDVWTQSLLRPLHDGLLRLLSTIITDGTFDQLAPVRRLYELGHTEFYSFDLTAATDRLPVRLQGQVLSILVNKEFSENWVKLLTSRPWYLKLVPYFYSVGQPMGALSSWAMMSLTHHILVQVAARRSGWNSPFLDYAVLGDDLVIANKAVAIAYLSLMKGLGVSINMDKSLVSKDGVLEFAKRLFWRGLDLSPLPPKLVSSLLRGLRFLPEVASDMMSRGLKLQTEALLLDKRVKPSIRWEIVGPLGILPDQGLSPFLGDRTLDQDELRRLAEAVAVVCNRKMIKAFYAFQNSSQFLISKLCNVIYDGIIPLKAQSAENYVKQYRLESELLWSGWLMPEEIEWVETKYPMDTPALQWMVQSLIEEVTRKNSSPPVALVPPDGILSELQVAEFINHSVQYLEEVQYSIPDITEKSVPTIVQHNKYKLYFEIDREFEKLRFSS
nr:MAG: putative RNA dependent RNA polymerase [Yunnan mito-like virus 44]